MSAVVAPVEGRGQAGHSREIYRSAIQIEVFDDVLRNVPAASAGYQFLPAARLGVESGLYFDASQLTITAGVKFYPIPGNWSPFATAAVSVVWFTVPVSSTVKAFQYASAGAGLEYRSYRGTLFRVTVYPRLFVRDRLPAVGLTLGQAF